jgi:hypothetical protein
METEKGAAQIIIRLDNGKLTIWHGETFDVLHERTADKGIWNAIWDLVQNY